MMSRCQTIFILGMYDSLVCPINFNVKCKFSFLPNLFWKTVLQSGIKHIFFDFTSDGIGKHKNVLNQPITHLR